MVKPFLFAIGRKGATPIGVPHLSGSVAIYSVGDCRFAVLMWQLTCEPYCSFVRVNYIGLKRLPLS